MKLPERLPRETGRDYALRVLKENIVNLEIAPGSQISENELSAALGISRAPIREALSELEKVKIVEIQPQKKTSVLLIDPALVEEARFMRSTLEDAVIGEVCMQRTEQDLFRLEENLTLQDLAFRSNALDQVMIKDNEFHRCFFEISRKPEIYQLMQTLQIHFDRVRNLTLAASGSGMSRTRGFGSERILSGYRSTVPLYGKHILSISSNRYNHFVGSTERIWSARRSRKNSRR